MKEVGDVLKLDEPYKGAIVVGAALAVAALALDARDIRLIGVGMIMVGFGEWLNHPYRQIINGPYLVHDRSRSPRPIGLILDVVGAAILALGLVRLLWQ